MKGLKGLCRTCLGSGGVMVSLFDETVELMEAGSYTAVEILENFTSTTIHNKNYLPDQICVNCLNEIRRAYSFTLTCINSETILNQLQGVKVKLKNLKKMNPNEFESESNFVLNAVKEEPDAIIKGNADFHVTFKTEPELTIEDINCGEKEFNADEQPKCSAYEKHFASAGRFCEHTVTDHIDRNNCNEEFDCSQFEHLAKHFPTSDMLGIKNEKTSDFGEDLKKQTENLPITAKYCQHCSQHFTDLKMLKLHLCPKIGANRSDKAIALLHIEQKTNENPVQMSRKKCTDLKSKYQCDVCSKNFNYKGSLIVHMRIHTGETPFHCKVCSEKFRLSHLLRVHMETKHVNELSDGKPKFQCSVCSKIVPCKSNLVRHMRVHTDEKHFQCELCSDKFLFNSLLVTHMRTIHSEKLTNDKPKYQCSICFKGFENKNVLVTHMRSHSDQKNTLQIEHMEKKRTNELPHGKPMHECNFCSKAFRYNSDLLIHIRSHTKEKPFQCKLCLTKFRYKHFCSQMALTK